MTLRFALASLLASLLVATCFTGCATFTDAELGQIRQHGVAPALVGKMEKGRVLTPQDVIELTRRGVPDNFIIRQIQETGVDYILNRNDVKVLQKAKVSPAVLDALQGASDDFASQYVGPTRMMSSATYSGYPYYNYYPAYPYYSYPYPYGGLQVEVSGGRCWNGHHGR